MRFKLLVIALLALPFLAQAFNQSLTTPSGTFELNPYGNDNNSLKIYDHQGNYRGNLNSNPYDPNSISNPYGKYGNPFTRDSIYNNPDVFMEDY